VFRDSSVLNGFIVIEGIDGSGTSTQRQMLCAALKNNSIKVQETHEPSNNPIGMLIRQALQKKIQLTQETLCRLFAADRGEHFFGIGGIYEQLSEGKVVVSDRSLFSSYAYQSLYSPLDLIVELNYRFPLPQVLIFIDTDPETSAHRRSLRGESEELFDEEQIQIQVYRNYKNIIQTLMEEQPLVTIAIFDGKESIETLHQKILRTVLKQVRPSSDTY
jgi:dTMP kinase